MRDADIVTIFRQSANITTTRESDTAQLERLSRLHIEKRAARILLSTEGVGETTSNPLFNADEARLREKLAVYTPQLARPNE